MVAPPLRSIARVPNRVKLCAIAQDEGPYLADWVFHHLHLGFDAVEVWVNGSSDTSVQVMEALAATYEQVGFRVADRLLVDSLRRGRWFQYRAYARMARRARREGFTHAAFLDLDEYWLAGDLATGIHAFLPEDDDVAVVSFPWAVDVPRHDRAAFGHCFEPPVRVQLDPHVKSVVRLDDRVVQVRPHTARTTSGTRLLVRDPFPLLEDQEQQQWGSFVPAEPFAPMRATLPEAFVLHTVNRSQTEYLASLVKPQRTAATDPDFAFRTNRRGFVALDGPVLGVHLPEDQRASYLRDRALFRARAGVDGLVEQAEASATDRAASVVEQAAADPALLERLRGVLYGVRSPVLDQRHPGWDDHLESWVDAVAQEDGVVSITGWAFSGAGRELELGLRDPSGAWWPPRSVTWSPRPDVVAVHPGAPLECGFRAELPAAPALGDGAALVARPAGTAVWWSTPLPPPLRTGTGTDRTD